jgi:hypothetical protein
MQYTDSALHKQNNPHNINWNYMGLLLIFLLKTFFEWENVTCKHGYRPNHIIQYLLLVKKSTS